MRHSANTNDTIFVLVNKKFLFMSPFQAYAVRVRQLNIFYVGFIAVDLHFTAQIAKLWTTWVAGQDVYTYYIYNTLL